MAAPSLVLQTTYAELLERCSRAAFDTSFVEEDGTFMAKTVRSRRYWYFQLPTKAGRGQRYVGPETPELLKRIKQHQAFVDDERERRALVSTLVRSFGMPQPVTEIGETVAALARAGIFRLRSVLVGTAAYQTYSAMLGEKLPSATLQTGDIDIAQFANISAAAEDQMPPMLDILKAVDKTFRAVPTIHGNAVTSYAAKGGFGVDFLTPNQGRETDKPKRLPALGTDAQPLRFLDFLIREPEPAVLLHGAGVYVNVPSPHRYAVHKLIISRRRPEGAAKRDKDLHQAEALLALLAKKRTYDLKAAWAEADARGQEWRKLLREGFTQLSPQTQEMLMGVIPAPGKPAKRKS